MSGPRVLFLPAFSAEIGGGHAIYISSAVEMLRPGTHFELVDISATSMDVARAMIQRPSGDQAGKGLSWRKWLSWRGGAEPSMGTR